jgi:hypothetical protein
VTAKGLDGVLRDRQKAAAEDRREDVQNWSLEARSIALPLLRSEGDQVD